VLNSPIPFLQDLCGGNVMLAKSATSPHGFTANVAPIPFLQDLCGGNVMLAKSATSPHGFTANVGCQPLCLVLT
jgi:hypothetical protein